MAASSPQPLLAASLLALAGCGTIGLDATTDSGVQSSEDDLSELRIDALSPSYAPLAGGTEVVISGVGFNGDVSFWFGNSQVDVTVLDPQTLVVETPAVALEATVDVRLQTDLGELTLPQAFTFTDAAGGDDGGDSGSGSGGSGSGGSGSGGAGSGGSGSAAGLVSGRVEFDALAIGCPSCFGYSTNTYAVTEAVFHEPAAVDWTAWMPRPGQCALNPTIPDAVSRSLDVGSNVVLQTGATTLAFSRTNRDGLTVYQDNSAQFGDYVKNASWDLSMSDGGSLGPHTVSGALRTVPSGFTDIQPIEILNDDYYAFPYMSVGYGASFSWAPAGVSDAVVIDILVFDSYSGALSGEIFCVASDSGGFTVPASQFGTFYEYDLAAIFIYRWDQNDAISPIDGSTIQGMTAFGALGSATIVL
jgi:hypothetical protein